MKKLIRFIVSFILCQGAGLLGSFFVAPEISAWYLGLAKPALNPPSWVFGPVWFIIYTLMAFSIWFIWNKMGENKRAKSAFVVFWAHLVINAIWTPVFFGLQNVFLALIIIVILLALIAYLIYVFWRIDRKASWLLVPYFVWVLFATYLNYSILLLN